MLSQKVSPQIRPIDSPKDRSQFKVALICALPLEADAVISLFDDHWELKNGSYGKSRGDKNAYTTGRIGEHTVVVVHMPNMGKTTAAFVAQGVKASFPNIKLALVVGICGGVPYDSYHRDLYLGDVVISKSLIQYDFGRRYPTAFEPKDSLEGGSGKQTHEIRSILAKLETLYNRELLQASTNRYLSKIQQGRASIKYPGAEVDTLFESSFTHQHQDTHRCNMCQAKDFKTCSRAMKSSCKELECDKTGLISRRRSDNRSCGDATTAERTFPPAIHIGNMGSGDTVMKSATHRDEVAKEHGVIAFEMEGAGIWDYFPSLVIKGICDYADSHKNKQWQQYAAVTAAAAAKAFLEKWDSES